MKKEVILVTGLSGAGKTSATSVLEDMGYHVIDQFPVQILSLLIDLIENTTDVRYEHTALTFPINDFDEFYRIFSNEEMNIKVKILFLDASEDVLLHRYKFTRRTHPLLVGNKVASLNEAIELERNLFKKGSDKATYIIDTTYINNKQLKSKMESIFKIEERTNFTISFESFGYKHGVPLDADLILDVRFLPNPFWDLELRTFSGNDKKVYNYVMDKDDTRSYLKTLMPFLEYQFKEYARQGKNHFTVAIGCTGGQHRSVSITNYLYDNFSKSYTSYKSHRDVVDSNDKN